MYKRSLNLNFHAEHLDAARSVHLVGVHMISNGEVLIEINFSKVAKMYPVIKFVNAINKQNKEKAGI